MTVNLTDILAQAGGLQSVARDLGLSEDQAVAGAEALLPAILGRHEKAGAGSTRRAGGPRRTARSGAEPAAYRPEPGQRSAGTDFRLQRREPRSG